MIEKNKEFILLRNSFEDLGTISNISSILRIWSHFEGEDSNNPFKITIQYKSSVGDNMQRTKLSFDAIEKRDAAHQQLIEALNPIIFDVKNELDSIM